MEFGVTAIKDITFTGTPGESYSIYLSSDGIDLTKKSNQQYVSSTESATNDFEIAVNLRECEVGE